MHDGYLFTIGVGEVGDATAPILLAAMAALPPVKRVALLGDVRPYDGRVQRGDMLDGVLDDLRDAELAVLAVPAPPWGLSGRLTALLDRTIALASQGSLRGLEVVALVAGPGAALGSERLQAWGTVAGMRLHIMGTATLPDDPQPFIMRVQAGYRVASQGLLARRGTGTHQ